MGAIGQPERAARILAVTTRHQAAREWTRQRCQEHWGEVALASPEYDFTETDYYAASMGTGLEKMFLVTSGWQDAGELADWKRATNEWEAEYAALRLHPEPRPLNLDPGYLTLGKLVLASTKNHAHRIYLRDGIYAEVTLSYRAGAWQHYGWTYPDYQRADYQEFFDEVRRLLRQWSREMVD